MRSTHSTQSKRPVSSGVRKKITEKEAVFTSRNRRTAISPYIRKCKRYAKQGVKSLLLSPVFHSSFKIIAVTTVVTGMLYASYLYIGKTFANEIVISQSEIISRVGKLTSLPQEDPYEIVRVQDEEDLRKQNPFYKDVKEGQYILMYKNIAVIYDLRNNVIIGIKRD